MCNISVQDLNIIIASKFKSKNNITAMYLQENNHVVNFENLPIKNWNKAYFKVTVRAEVIYKSWET